jgi:nitrogen fixation/metabolism regulation signal transduction histidine kinase
MALGSSAHRNHVLGVSLRAAIVGGLAFLLVRILTTTEFYATALVVAAITALVIADLARVISARQRSTLPLQRALTQIDSARAEQQREVQYLQTLLDTVSPALFVIRSNGQVILANRSAHKVAGMPIDKLEQAPSIGASAARALLALDPGARQIVELADGQQVLATVAQFSGPDRELLRMMSLQRITGELDVVELKAWRDMAQVLAHEMMNSLTPIASLSESLEVLLKDASTGRHPEEERASAEITGAVEAIKRRSLGLMHFVERYRQVAELPQPKPQAIRLDEFLIGIERLLSAQFKDRRISCTRRVMPSDLSISADPELLEQAIINLLRNASEAVATEAEPRIEILCQECDGAITIAVADNGCGLPEKARDQIFVPFFTTKAGGSGIGLNLARHVALAHGGQLEARANHSRGTIFSMTLPLAARSIRL